MMQNASSKQMHLKILKISGFYKLQRTHATERIPHHAAQVGKVIPLVEVLVLTPPTQRHWEPKTIYMDVLCS